MTLTNPKLRSGFHAAWREIPNVWRGITRFVGPRFAKCRSHGGPLASLMPRQNQDQKALQGSQVEAVIVEIEIVVIVTLIVWAIKLLRRE